MSSIVIRFPNGDRHFHMSTKLYKAGDLVQHNGTRYRVTDVRPHRDAYLVTVEPDLPTIADLMKSEEGAMVVEEFIDAA